MSATIEARPQRSASARYRQSLWLLTSRDLKVRYTTSFLGYVWSILDPLLMSAIYYLVFVGIFHRGQPSEQPYIVFLIVGLLPWTWFNGVIQDSGKAFTRDSKLIRSTMIPRTIWVVRGVLTKGIEFLLSIPVLAVFIALSYLTKTPAHLHWEAVLWIPAILLEAVLVTGLGLIVAPLVVFFRDLERAIRLILRLLFYASPIVYSSTQLDGLPVAGPIIEYLNPLSGIFGMYRAAFFPAQFQPLTVLTSSVISLALLGVGVLVFRRSIRAVLKEI